MIIFHTEIRNRLSGQFQRGTLAQAYLLIGARGVGKFTLAQWIARMLVCEQDGAGRPCENCHACRAVDTRTHPDVRIMPEDRASPIISVEEFRGVREQLARTPLRASVAVTIVPDSERLSRAAQHAFLKTLEEPRPRTLLIMTAASPSALLPTILSRMTTVRLMPVPRTMLERALKELDPACPPETFDELLRIAHGIPGTILVHGALDPSLPARREMRTMVGTWCGKPFWQVSQALRQRVHKEDVYAEAAPVLDEIIRQCVHRGEWYHHRDALDPLYRSLDRSVNKDLAMDALTLSLSTMS